MITYRSKSKLCCQLNRVRYLIFILFFFMMLSKDGYSQNMNGIGKYGASFLQISSSARQVAMGEAFTGLADDINFLRYNIGGLGNIQNPTLGVNFHKWYKDTQQGAIGIALPTQFGILGFDIVYFNEGAVTEFIDENFLPSGSEVSSNDIAMTLGYGSYINLFKRKISLGAALKIVRQNLASQTATAMGLDLGFLLNTEYISYGATIQNFGLTKLKFVEREDPLPETYRCGVSVHFPFANYFRLNTDADLAWTMDQKVRSYLGGEIIISDLIAVRGGYKIHDFESNRWGAGLGLMIPMEWLANSQSRLDYSYSPLDAFSTSTHRFSLVFTFGTTTQLQKVGVSESAEKEISKLKAELEKELAAAEKARKAAEDAELRTRELEEKMNDRFNYVKNIAEKSDKKIEMVSDKPGDSLIFRTHINFDFDKAEIREEDFGTMKEIGDILNTYPEYKIHVSGHTDFIGTDEYNIRLSQRRVDNVITYLSKQENVVENRFYMPIGYGELKPVATNKTEEGRFRNRRVEFVILTNNNEPTIPDGSAIMNVAVLNQSTIKITCNGKVSFTHNLISNPDRLIIDFPGIFLLSDETNIELSQGPFIRARMGYHPTEKFSRIVIDLMYPIKYKIETEDNIIYIRLP